MTIVLSVLVLLLSGLLLHLMADTAKIPGGGRGGASMQLMYVLPLRWLCLAGLLAICVSRGAIPWPATPGGQYLVVFIAHALLGFISLTLAGAELESGLPVLRWVPFLLPVAEIALAVSTLIPEQETASALRVGSLWALAVVGGGPGLFLAGSGLVSYIGNSRAEIAEERAEEEKDREALRKIADSPLPTWFKFIEKDIKHAVRLEAVAAMKRRPGLVEELRELIGSSDNEIAYEAMHFVGGMEPPPEELAEAIRARADDVVLRAESIDPAAADSADRLWRRASYLTSGVISAARGMRRAGIDLRPELHNIARAAAPREKSEPRHISGDCEQAIRYFDLLDRQGIAGHPK
jgi:hypothetical protein